MLSLGCMSDQSTVNDILEIVQFIKDNSATKQDLSNLEVRVDKRFESMDQRFDLISDQMQDMKTEVITHVDGLAVLHQRLDTELAALRMKYERLESHVSILAKHANIQLDF